jgi:hypothetical protein
MTIKDNYLVNQARGLELDHNLRPQFQFDSTHRVYRCILVNKLTKEVAHMATSAASEEESFRNALKTIDIGAITSNTQDISQANRDLHERIRDLESKLEDQPSTPDETKPSEHATTSGGNTTANKKKTMKKRTPRASSLNLPSDADHGVGVSKI